MEKFQNDKIYDMDIPLLHTFGAEIVRIEERRAVIKMASRPEFADTAGGLNGTIIASAANLAALVAVKALRINALNVEAAIHFFSPVYLGSELLLQSQVVHIGGKLIYTEVYVMNGEFLVAKGNVTFFIVS